MKSDSLRYDRMVERALRTVVREALTEAAEEGLPGDHHFYITFATRYAGVEIPPYLRTQYPEEMTIVIQYQFYGLTIEADRFSVTLSFNNAKERLTVPFAAVTTFADPAVNFALQFQTTTLDIDEEPIDFDAVDDGDVDATDVTDATAETPETEPGKSDGPEAPSGKVVTLDQFRKKQERPSG